MSLAEAPPVTVAVGTGTVEFPRYVFRRGAQMSEEQHAREAAAFAEADRLMGYRGPGDRQPGDDDGCAPDTRTREQREQDVDFEAEAVKIVANLQWVQRQMAETAHHISEATAKGAEALAISEQAARWGGA